MGTPKVRILGMESFMGLGPARASFISCKMDRRPAFAYIAHAVE